MDINGLAQVLHCSLNADDNIRRPAESQIMEFEKQPGFCTSLCEISFTKTIPVNVRLIAIVCMKNVVEKYWRPTATNPVSAAEKSALRNRILDVILVEENDQIALQMALLTGKIARADFPLQWPDPHKHVLTRLQQANISLQQRSRMLLVLHHVVVALCSHRIARNRSQFQQTAPEIFQATSVAWNDATDQLIARLSAFASSTINAAELNEQLPVAQFSILCLKILRRCVVHGFPNLHQFPITIAFLNAVLERLKAFTNCRSSVAPNPLSQSIDKTIVLYNKILIKAQRSHPISYVSMLVPSLNFYWQQLQTAPMLPNQMERAVVQAIIFIKDVLSCPTYVPDSDQLTARSVNQPANTPYTEAHNATAQFFTPVVVAEIARVLIVSYLRMNADDLKEWESAPEDFIRDQDTKAWKVQRRASAEVLLLTLLSHHVAAVSGTIVTLLQQVVADQSDSDSSLLLKEAVYNALGIGYYELFEDARLDYVALLNNVFSRELRNPHQGYKIIRRRIAWLLSRWLHKTPATMRKAVYEALITIMSEPDIVLFVTAADSLKVVIDDVEFRLEDFQEYVERTVVLLFSRLASLEVDTQLRVLSVITVMITQLEDRIRPYTTVILGTLATLWESASKQQEHLLKSAVVRALKHLIDSLSCDAVGQFPQLVSVVEYSTNVAREDSVYLIEDGLALWQALLHQASQLHEGLMNVFPNLTAVMDMNFDNIEICMKILETYILLGGPQFMMKYAQQVSALFIKVIGDIKDEGLMLTLRPMETLVQLYPQASPPLLEGSLHKILSLTLSKDESELAVTQYLNLFARIALHNVQFFMQFFSYPQYASQNLLAALFNVWFEKFDYMPARARKLSALAMCNLMSVPSPATLAAAPMIVTTVVGVIPEVDDPKSLLVDEDAAAFSLEDHYSSSTSAAERALVQMRKADIVTKLSLRESLDIKSREATAVHGAAFEQQMKTIDPAILKPLQAPSK